MTSREGATLIVLGAFVAWALSRRDVRSSVANVMAQFGQLAIAIPMLALAGSVTIAAYVAHALGFWTFDLTAATLLWFVFVGFRWFLGIADAGKEPGFVKHRVVEAVGISALFEFFLNIETFPIWVEVIGQVVIIFLV